MKQILIDQAGPLPISIEIDDPGDIPVIIEFSGSCYTNKNIGLTGINLQINGQDQGNSLIWANQLNVHLATVPKAISVNLDPSQARPGKHTITLTNAPNTVTDLNDWFTVLINY